MGTLNIKVDISGVTAQVRQAYYMAVFPKLSAAVEAVTQAASLRWMDGVQRARLWNQEKAAYIQSIKWEMTGPFSGRVWTDYRRAEAIENGQPARDLKDMLNSSLKVRTNKSGKRFLIIPFRHNMPGNSAHAPAMPTSVYEMVSSDSFKKSSVVGQGRRLSGTGAMDISTRGPLSVHQAKYVWGDRLKHDGALARPHHKTSIYDGMVRMQTDSGKAKSSAYLTFRNMTQGSQGWIVPAKPGMKIAEAVRDEIQPKADAVFREAFQADMT